MQDLVINKPLLVPTHLTDVSGINVSACAYPFTAGMQSFTVAEGANISEILYTITQHPLMVLHAHVYLNDTYIPKEYWSRVYPKTGTTLSVKVIPGKGGGKNPLRTVLMIAVIAAAAWAGPMIATSLGFAAPAAGATASAGFTIASAIGSAVVNAVGSLLINAIAPPAKQRASSISSTGSTADSDTLFIEGSRNVPDFYGVVPIIFGRHLVVPKLASNNYTETVGNDQYVRQLFALGLGKYNRYNPKLGTTNITDFTDVEINQYLNGEGSNANLQLYPESVYQDDFSVQLIAGADWTIRTTQPGADEFIIDITYPQGIVIYSADTGKKQALDVRVEMQYRQTGTSTWSSSYFFDRKEAITSAVRDPHRIITGGAQYDIRMRKIDVSGSSNPNMFQDAWWSGIKTITHENPVNMVGLSLAEMRIKATGQLNGTVDNFQEELFSVLPDYDSTTGTWIERETRNPASFFLFVCHNSALFESSGVPLVDAPNARPLALDRIQLADIETFHTHCKDNGFEYNAVIDFETSVWDILSEIASAGRAAPTLVDGKWSVVIDRIQTTVAQYFTPANTWGYSATKVFPEIPHAFRVQFINEEAGYLQDEMLVYADGYNKTNATKIEGIQLPGITKPSLIYRHAREHLATLQLRPIEHSFYCDVEHLVATRGRLIKFAHDVPLIGIAQGYITQVITDGGSPLKITGVVLDREVTLVSGKSYSLRVRDSETRSSVYKQVIANVGSSNTLYFTTPFLRTEGIYVDDLFMFGETGKETIDLIVKDIYAESDFVAKLVCVDAAPAIFSAGTGTIPAWESNITIPEEMLRPFAPVIVQVQTGAEAQVYNTDGTISSRMIITLQNRNGFDVVPYVKIRVSDTNTFIDAPTLVATATQVIIDNLNQDTLYDVQVYYKRSNSGVLTNNVHSPLTQQNYIRFEGVLDNPPNVTNFKVQLVNNLILLTWDPINIIDFAYYELRYTPTIVGATWATAQVVKTGLTAAETVLAAATGTFMIKAFDTGGRGSTTETLTSLSVVLEGTNAVTTVTEDSGFTGTHDNTLVTSGGKLELNNLSLTTGIYYFHTVVDLSEVYPCTVVPHISATGHNTGNTLNNWPVLSLLDSLAGSTPAAWYLILEEAHTNDNPSGSPTWTSWAPLTLGNYTFRAIKFRIKLFGNGTNVTPSISELSVLIDMPDRVEKLLNQTIASGGSHITYSPAFKATPVMTYAITDGVAGDKVEVTNETSAGFDIKVTNGGSNVVRHANIHIIGYGRVQ